MPLAVLRPPGAVVEAELLERCVRCGQCVEVCPRGALRPLPPSFGPAAGTPFLVPREAPCVLCDGLQCTTVCPSGTLRPLAREEVRIGLAVIQPSRCLPHRGSACDACAAACPIAGALRLVDGLPEIDPARCTGCGLCEEVCPTEPAAVLIHPYV